MDIIICDISAWEYWRCPPALRDVDIPLEVACAPQPVGLGMDRKTFRPRANAREAETLIRPRLLTDLKALTLPIHVMLAPHLRHSSPSIAAHRMPEHLSQRHVIPLGNGIGILSPAATLIFQQNKPPALRALDMLEAAGIYAVHNETPQTAFVLNALLNSGKLSPELSKSNLHGVREAFDSLGKPALRASAFSDRYDWVPSFSPYGTPTDIWKRPPLITAEELRLLSMQYKGVRGTGDALRASRMVRDGSGSPLESRAFLLLTSGPWNGGEKWRMPTLNMRVDFSEQAQMLAHQSYCIVDMHWPDRKGCLEILGEAYHTDRLGFKLETGREAALESMGYTVVELTYEQLADLAKFDAIIEAHARRLGLPLQRKTASFLKRRDALHRLLFPSKLASLHRS